MPFVQDFKRDSGVLVTIPNDTHLIHNGNGFTHHNRHVVNNNTTFDHLIVTPANVEIHMRQWSFKPGTGPFTIEVYEDTVVSNNGTAEPVGNLNRSSTNIANFQLFHTPTITNVGNLILSDYANGDNKIGQDAAGTLEWVLKKNTKYLFRVNNVAAGNTNIVFTMFWYEMNG